MNASIVGHYIGGQTVRARRPPAGLQPATGAVARHVALATPDEVARAVASAQAAFPPGRTRRRSAAPASCSSSWSC